MVEAKLVSSSTPLAPTEGRALGERLRLPYLDGLRGVASLYVVLGHVYIALVYFSDKVQLPRSLYYFLRIFNVGQTAVDVFIVLSGYCLMLPVLLNAGRLPGGVFDYFVRRAKRIFPAYYAALVLALGVIGLAGVFGLPLTMPSPWAGALLSHLLLVHNFDPSWIHAFNPPMWSVAVEWQIYFALPFVLLPLWHRFGPFVSAAGGVALGLALHWLPGGRLDYSFPWYLGLFALGTLAASISLGTSSLLVRVRQAMPWMVIALLLFVGLAIPFGVMPGFYKSNQLLSDQLVGLATACLLIACTKHSLEEARPSLVLKILSSRAARWLGAISYSLYLVHYPLLEFFWHATLAIEMSASVRAALMYLVFVPLVLLVAHGFAALFERPFVRRRAPAPKAHVVPA
jgi:peptidoglycan/LPS O-acetylase OafA/YrhL